MVPERVANVPVVFHPAIRYNFVVLASLNRPKFGFYDLSHNPITVFRPDPLAARAGLGFELHFSVTNRSSDGHCSG